MIWLAAALLSLLALAPVAVALRRRVQVRGRREAALALYKAQAAELDRDRAEGRISAADHGTAVLEVQKRLLAAANAPDAPTAATDRAPLVTALALVPLAALGLYLVDGRPEMPAQPLAQRLSEADRRTADQAAFASRIRQLLQTADPRSDQARQGELMLGNIEARQGRYAQAVEAWRKALAVKFEPLLAAEIADATSRVEGRVSEASAALFRQALASAPPDAPWREQVEQRLAEALPRDAATPHP